MTVRPIFYLFWMLIICPMTLLLGCTQGDWTTQACPISQPTPLPSHDFLKLKEILSKNILYTLQSHPHPHALTPYLAPKPHHIPHTTAPNISLPSPNSPCIDINKDNIHRLTQLPGIGQTKAQNIIQMRQKKPFQRKKDIQKIRGIGSKTYQKLAPMLCDI